MQATYYHLEKTFQVECWFPSFALLDYRVTNQIYIYVTRKSSSVNSEIKQGKLGNQAVPNEA